METFDFAWLEKAEDGEQVNPIYIKVHPDPERMKHSFPPVNRCCKRPPPGFTFDGIDEVIKD